MSVVATPSAQLPARRRPAAIQVSLGGRWIAGQLLGERSGPAGAEALVSHHGHLVWVPRRDIRPVG